MAGWKGPHAAHRDGETFISVIPGMEGVAVNPPLPLPGLELLARAWEKEAECPVLPCMISNPNHRFWMKRRKEEDILGTLAFDFRDVGDQRDRKKNTT